MQAIKGGCELASSGSLVGGGYLWLEERVVGIWVIDFKEGGDN